MAESTNTVSSASINQAQLILADTENLIRDEAQSSGEKKRSKGRSRDILGKVNRVVGVIEQMAKLHPAAEATVKIFKGLLKLECDRRENSEQIVILFHSMASMLFVLRNLDRILFNDEHELASHLAEVLEQTSMTMERFGDLADLYYNKCKQPVVRFLKASDFRQRIRFFNDQFMKHKADLQSMLILRMEVRTFEQSYEIEQIKLNTERIINRLGEPSSEEEMRAAALVRETGLDRAIHDKGILEQISTLIGGGRVTGTNQALLEVNLDDMLAQNMEAFHRKLDNSMTQVTDTISKAREDILRKLDSGPHELIDDPDIREVWRGNAWKLSVKCRQFVDEVTNHYEEKFRNEAITSDGNPPKDQWTLTVLSKVMHHPAIGDAIDEDGSGFISLYETKDFLSQCPKGWSTPEWLVYWAIGWQMNNIKYNSMIIDTLDDIASTCLKLIENDSNDTISPLVSQYMDKINLLRNVTAWANGIHAEANAQDISNEGEARLRELLEEASKNEIVMLTERLDVLKWVLDDPADFPVLLGGTDVRIELIFMTIMHLLVGKHHDLIRGPPHLTDGDWETMAETLHMLVNYFHERMQALLRGWRAQKLNVELNITCFAGGIYNGWYYAYNNPNGEAKRLLEKNPNKPGADVMDTAQSNARILAQINTLTQRVDKIDSRMDSIDSRMDSIVTMLQALLAANSIRSSAVLAPSHPHLQTSTMSVPSHKNRPSTIVDRPLEALKATKEVLKVVNGLAESTSSGKSSPTQLDNHIPPGSSTAHMPDDSSTYEGTIFDGYYAPEPREARLPNPTKVAVATAIDSNSSDGELSITSPEQQSPGNYNVAPEPFQSIPFPSTNGFFASSDTQNTSGSSETNGLRQESTGELPYLNDGFQFPRKKDIIPTNVIPKDVIPSNMISSDMLPSEVMPDVGGLKEMVGGVKSGMKAFSAINTAVGDRKARSVDAQKSRPRQSSQTGNRAEMGQDPRPQNYDRYQPPRTSPPYVEESQNWRMPKKLPESYEFPPQTAPLRPSAFPSGYTVAGISGNPLNTTWSKTSYSSSSRPPTGTQSSDMEESEGRSGNLFQRLRKMSSSKSLPKSPKDKKPTGPRSPAYRGNIYV